MPTTSSTGSTSTINSHLTDPSTENPPTESSTESPKGTTAPVSTFQPPSKVPGVHVTLNTGVQNTSPTLTVTWHALASGAVTYNVKYSTQPGEVNTPPEGALEVMGISGNSTILTALERGTTYYIWVVGVSEGGEGLYSDRTSRVTNGSEFTASFVHCCKVNGLGCISFLCLCHIYIIVNFQLCIYLS